jgi:hypothetical protein
MLVKLLIAKWTIQAEEYASIIAAIRPTPREDSH